TQVVEERRAAGAARLETAVASVRRVEASRRGCAAPQPPLVGSAGRRQIEADRSSATSGRLSRAAAAGRSAWLRRREGAVRGGGLGRGEGAGRARLQAPGSASRSPTPPGRAETCERFYAR